MLPTLSNDPIKSPGATPTSWWYFLHGIYGAGRNWASIARRIVRERPHVGIMLVDLRQHGDSQGFPAPHTMEAAAADLDRLADSTGVRPKGVLGHSFGGKVGLVYADEHPAGLEQVWVVDSTPQARAPAGSAWEMLEVIRSLPAEFASRKELVATLVQRGVDEPVAQWMATNLEHRGAAYRWRFDLDAIEALLHDFFETDAWSVVEHPPEGMQLHFVKAEKSSVLGAEEVARVEAAAHATGRVHLHTVPGGHWVNADAPDELITLMLAHAFPSP